jgi:glucose-1-phosphate cytidylyltransferase
MKVVILCGGMGTRFREMTEIIPKPMVPIGTYPIVWHIMKYFASFGHKDFVLCLGYKKDAFVDYFYNYRYRHSDMTVFLGDNNVELHESHPEDDWKVTLADTGLYTNTGGRVKRIERYITEGDFLLTYGDGLCSVDLRALVEFHRRMSKVMTVTAVHPSSRFGEINMSGDFIKAFAEKPQTSEGYINGGFMVVNRRLFDEYLNEDPNLDFEAQVMPAVANEGEMAGYRHDGFWQCMDTSREHQLLNKLWEAGDAPWRR